MKRIIRLTESDLTRIVRRVIMEQEQPIVFDKNYFNTNKTGKIELDPSVGAPSVLKVNGLSASWNPKTGAEPFNDYWTDETNPTGRGFNMIKGNDQFDYTYDGTNINLKPSSTNPSLKNWKEGQMQFMYIPK